MFLLFGVHLLVASWIYSFIVFITFGKLSAVISSNISLPQPLLLGFQLYLYVGPYELVPQPSDALFIYVFFLCFVLGYFYYYIFKFITFILQCLIY